MLRAQLESENLDLLYSKLVPFFLTNDDETGKFFRRLKMSKGKCALMLFFSFFFIFTFAGCLAVATGIGAAGAVMWYQGELKVDLNAPPEKVIAATERAFASFKWHQISASSSKTDGQAVARTGADKRVDVLVKQKTETTSEIGIRVGVMGDENLSRTLLDKIQIYLE